MVQRVGGKHLGGVLRCGHSVKHRPTEARILLAVHAERGPAEWCEDGRIFRIFFLSVTCLWKVRYSVLVMLCTVQRGYVRAVFLKCFCDSEFPGTLVNIQRPGPLLLQGAWAFTWSLHTPELGSHCHCADSSKTISCQLTKELYTLNGGCQPCQRIAIPWGAFEPHMHGPLSSLIQWDSLGGEPRISTIIKSPH